MSAATAAASAPRKISGKQGCGRRLTHSEAQTSTQELALAKPLKRRVKFAAKSSALSPTEKASLAAGKKTFSTSAGASGTVHARKHVLNLFGSDLSASDGEAASSERVYRSPLRRKVCLSYLFFFLLVLRTMRLDPISLSLRCNGGTLIYWWW
jgi:hypothetical protein